MRWTVSLMVIVGVDMVVSLPHLLSSISETASRRAAVATGVVAAAPGQGSAARAVRTPGPDQPGTRPRRFGLILLLLMVGLADSARASFETVARNEGRLIITGSSGRAGARHGTR